MDVFNDLLEHDALKPITLVLGAAFVLFSVYQLAASRRRRRRQMLLQAEYDRVVAERVGAATSGAPPASQVVLPGSTTGVRALESAQRRRYAAEWSAVQEEFVDSPATAIAAADRLIVDVMRARGYPVDDATDVADVVARHHPRAAASFRAARALTVGDRASEATIDYLRQSFLHQRALFQELVDNVAHIDLTVGEALRTESYHRWFRGAGHR